MLHLRSGRIVLEPTNQPFEQQAVLNPAAVQLGKTTHLFYRAINKDNVSTIGHCEYANGTLAARNPQPILEPEFEYERQGIEDPRITYFDGLYYLLYTAFDGLNARIAYATSPDLVHFKKHGLISPSISYAKANKIFEAHHAGQEYSLFYQYFKHEFSPDILLWDKDAMLFPKKINGKFALIHRILPSIQVVYFDDFEELKDPAFWEHYLAELERHTLLQPKHWFETRNIGGGCPPIEIDEGWLFIYHGIETTPKGLKYHAGAALLDRENPQHVIGRLSEPLFSPEAPWERQGLVNNVVFPTGAIKEDKTLHVYYGAADAKIAVHDINIQELVHALTTQT